MQKSILTVSIIKVKLLRRNSWVSQNAFKINIKTCECNLCIKQLCDLNPINWVWHSWVSLVIRKCTQTQKPFQEQNFQEHSISCVNAPMIIHAFISRLINEVNVHTTCAWISAQPLLDDKCMSFYGVSFKRVLHCAFPHFKWRGVYYMCLLNTL